MKLALIASVLMLSTASLVGCGPRAGSGGNGPAAVAAQTSLPVGHTWFQHVSDQQLGAAMQDCHTPPVDAAAPSVSSAAAAATATTGVQYLYKITPAANTITETSMCIRYGTPYWVVLFIPAGGFDSVGEQGVIHQSAAVEEINASTGVDTHGFTLNFTP